MPESLLDIPVDFDELDRRDCERCGARLVLTETFSPKYEAAANLSAAQAVAAAREAVGAIKQAADPVQWVAAQGELGFGLADIRDRGARPPILRTAGRCSPSRRPARP